MWSLLIFFVAVGLGVAGLVRGIRGGQKERKQLIQVLIFIVGIFLFLVALTPQFFPNRYDSGHVSGPAVLPTEDGYRMYFTGFTLSVGIGRQGAGSIGIAESEDGETWTKHEGGPVLRRSLAKFSDGYAIMEPSIAQKGDTYYMYYVGKSYKGSTAIGLATSADGVSWQKSAENPVLTAERDVPTPAEVEGWSDEQVEDFLASCGYTDDFFKVSKKVWLADVLSIVQRQPDASYEERYRRARQEYLDAKEEADKELRDAAAGVEGDEARDTARQALKAIKGAWRDQEARLLLRWHGDPGFFPNVRIKALATAGYVLGDGKVPDGCSIAPGTTIKDLGAVKTKLDAWSKSRLDAWVKLKSVLDTWFKFESVTGLPDWGDVSVLPDKEINQVVAVLGVPTTAFEIPKREYLLTVAKIVAEEIGWAEALPYLKVTNPSLASEGASHIDFYQIYRDLKESLARGIDGKGFGDLSVVYDESADEFRMWYIAQGFKGDDLPDELKGSFLAYATSKDGIAWKRASRGELQDMIALGNVSAVSVIREGEGYRAALVKGGKVSLAYSADGVTGWVIDRPDVLSPGDRPKFDSKGIVSLALHKADGNYLLWYAGQACDADKPLPTEYKLEEMSNKKLFKLAEKVGCRMGWNRTECRRFLKYAHDIVDKGSTYETYVDSLKKSWTSRTADGAIFSYDADRVREITKRYDIEVPVEDPLYLMDIAREDIIWNIRKVFLMRCLVKYGRGLEYPSLEQVGRMTTDELVALWPRYGVQPLQPLPKPDEQLSDERRERLVKSMCAGLQLYARYKRTLEGHPDYPSRQAIDSMDYQGLLEACRTYNVECCQIQPDSVQQLTEEEIAAVRDAVRLFVVLCAGQREDLDAFTQEELVRIAANNGVLVELSRVRKMRKRNLEKVDPDLLRETIEQKVGKRVEDYLKTKPIVTRIGLATSADGVTWDKAREDEELGCVLDARHRFEKTRNPLQETIEGKVADYLVLLGWMAIFLGTMNLFRHHGRIVLRVRANWFYSSMFFFSFFFMLICSAVFYPASSKFVRVPDPVHFSEAFIADPLIATILGLLGYYITSAAYRAFRVKNIEATVMMVVAVFVMLGNVPALEPLTRNNLLHTVFDQLHFPLWRDWIMSKGNAAVFRALNFGLAIGVVAMSIRIIFGIERGAFFEKL